MLDDNDDIHTVIASIGERLTGSIVTIGGEIADLHAGNGHSEPLMIIFRTDAENRQARIAERCGSTSLRALEDSRWRVANAD
jgi:hypothetical protein